MHKFYKDRAEVLLQYKKTSTSRKNPYTVLKLKSREGFSYYTTTRDKLKDLQGRVVKLGLITSGVDFAGFLSTFYAPSFSISLSREQGTQKKKLENYIDAQHQDPELAESFRALFLADRIGPDLRSQVSKWGIAHLFALSGFHLVLLGGIVFLLLYYPYIFLQKRYFRHRNRNFDLFVISAVLLFAYMLFVGSPPSLLRSFVMFFIGGVLYFFHVKVLSFEFLLWLLLLLLALFPYLLFSIGFWLSIGGVFYIYLFLHYFKDMPKFWLVVWLNGYLFLSMLPFAHLFFGVYSGFSLLSPFVSIVFGIFYPIELFLHAVGFGGMLDGFLSWFFALPQAYVDVRLDWYLFVIYAGVSLGAVFKKFFLWLQIGFGVLFLAYLNVLFFTGVF